MTTPGQPPAHDNPPLVWAAAVIVAALGAWIMFDAMPGVNWGIWTAGAALGLIIVARDRGTLGNSTTLMLAVAILLGAGAAVTADQFILAMTCLAVIVFLSLAMLLSVAPGLDALSTVRMVASPVIAAGTALAESFARVIDLTRIFHSDRARATVRGIAITIPIVVVFALLLSSADPIFAGWRDEIGQIIETWSFIPRTIFFLVLLTIVLGAYSFASRGSSSIAISFGRCGRVSWG